MSDEHPAGEPRHDGQETPADGPPPPPYPPEPYPPPPPPPGTSGYGYQEWPHEAPPGTVLHKDPQAVPRGVRAAATIFGAAVLLHLVTLAVVKVMGGNEAGWIFIPEGLFVIVAGFIAAIVATMKLPLDSRAAFWISGILFMALSFIIWGATCAMAL